MPTSWIASRPRGTCSATSHASAVGSPPPSRAGPGQVLALDQLHADVEQAAVLAVAVHRAHVAVAHAAGQPDLGAEALLDPARLAREVGAQHLDRDGLAELAVVSAVDHAHAAAAERTEDLEAGGEDRAVGEAGERRVERRSASEAIARIGQVVGKAGGAIHRTTIRDDSAVRARLPLGGSGGYSAQRKMAARPQYGRQEVR